VCLAIPAKIVSLVPGDEPHRALVEVVGVRRHIDTGLLQDEALRIGDWVLIHVGFALSKISEEQAQDQLRTLAMLGESEAALQEIEGYGAGELEPGASTTAGSEEPRR
jgi:hydrogenase expression/formation protein HypC